MNHFDTIRGLLADQNQIAARLHGWATTPTGRTGLKEAAAAILENNRRIAEELQHAESPGLAGHLDEPAPDEPAIAAGDEPAPRGKRKEGKS
jgi:hypothetical protein